MTESNNKLVELDKIKEIAPYPMHPYFITGYLAYALPPEISHQAKELTNQFMNMLQDHLITSFNVL